MEVLTDPVPLTVPVVTFRVKPFGVASEVKEELPSSHEHAGHLTGVVMVERQATELFQMASVAKVRVAEVGVGDVRTGVFEEVGEGLQVVGKKFVVVGECGDPFCLCVTETVVHHLRCSDPADV
jgi:hypothetical protein